MRVRAIRTCFVGSFRKAGEEFEYDGPGNPHLEPVKPPKPATVPKGAGATSKATGPEAGTGDHEDGKTEAAE